MVRGREGEAVGDLLGLGEVLFELLDGEADRFGCGVKLREDAGLECALRAGEYLLLLDRGVGEGGLVCHQAVSEVLLDHLEHGECLDADGLRVVLEVDLIAGVDLDLGEDVVLFEELLVLLCLDLWHRLREGLEVVEASLLCLSYPLIGVAVAVEDDASVLLEELLDELHRLCLEILRIDMLELRADLVECLGHGGVQYDVRVCDGK